MEARNLRKERTGVVVSNKMDKTITVAAKFKEKHPIYGDVYKRQVLRASFLFSADIFFLAPIIYYFIISSDYPAYFFLLPAWPRNVRVGANSPNLCPTMFSVT